MENETTPHCNVLRYTKHNRVTSQQESHKHFHKTVSEKMSPTFSNTVKLSICYWESEGDVHWESSLSQNYPGTFYLVPWADDRV